VKNLALERQRETGLVCGEVRGREIDSVTCVTYSFVDGKQNRKKCSR